MMKRLSILAAAVMAGASLFGAKKAPVVSNVEPPCWWVGMNNDTLQIMVTGPGIGNAEVSADYPGVTLTEQVKLDSPNYKFLYLTIAPDARPGKMPITFSLDGRKTTIDYPLLARDRKGEDYQGFDASDVLYPSCPTALPRENTPFPPILSSPTIPKQTALSLPRATAAISRASATISTTSTRWV